MKLKDFLEAFDFDYIKAEKDGEIVYKLKDLMGANLGGIEGETFYSIEAIVDRLDIYYDDYIYKDLSDEFGYDGDYICADVLKWLYTHTDNRMEYHRKLCECIADARLIEE